MRPAAASGCRAAAFFELDGTLVSGGPIRRLLWLQGCGMPPLARVLWLAGRLPRALHWRLLAGLNASRSRRLLQAQWAGQDAERLRELAERECPRLLGRRVFPAARDRLAWHRDQSHQLVLLSDELDLILAPLTRELGIQHLLAAAMHQHAGRLSGQLRKEPPVAAEQLRAVRDWAQRNAVELGQSWAYATSTDALPLLLAVAHPVVVNPDRGLADLARSRGWDSLVWRRR